MTEFNSYPIFVADQVLMADQLNEIVNYLDEQDRLTRNKLIGIGIVCGLELTITPSQISITKGCGVTSAGYSIVQDQLTLSYYKPYQLHSDFSPKYKSIYEQWHMWQLLTAEQSLEEEDVVSMEATKTFMRDKIVVLLLEMKEKPLKNCVDANCDDKGDKIEFAIKPLVVLQRDIDKFLKSLEDHHRSEEPQSSVQPVLHDVQLKRFNVPVSQLTSADVVLNAFLELVTEPQLKRLAEVLNYCYVHYKPILIEEPTNPFSNVLEVFKEKLSLIKNSNPLFIQYYYDWIDDLIKAYYEFKDKVFDVQVMCGPDDDMFPLHLMLGEATKSTSIDVKSRYRHYFLYSPLFNQQKDLLAETQLLFRRMKLLIENYSVPNPNTFANTAVKITPSKYLDKPISDRCIPYYYDPLNVFQSWSWSKTRKGNARYNLSYNANKYNTADPVVNPLLYDIERFNFFRVEGHIGKNYTEALSTVIGQRNQFNLPFEVVALSTATVARYVAADDKECLVNDLESLYQVIIAELVCKFGDLACSVADVSYQFNFTTGTIGAINPSIVEGLHAHANPSLSFSTSAFSTHEAAALNPKILSALLGTGNFSSFDIPNYKKGNFLKKHCAIKKGSVGEMYLSLVDRGNSFIKPANTNDLTINTVYAHLFYFLDCVENVMAVSWLYTLKDYTAPTFNSRFQALTETVSVISDRAAAIVEAGKGLLLESLVKRFPPLIHTCFDERLSALKNEYAKRYREIQALTNFMNYFKAHPGLEHKAGVPKGGTFILVYHETPPRTKRELNPNVFTNVPGAILEDVILPKDIFSTSHISALMKEAAVKDPAMLKNFQAALSKYLNICKDMDDNTKEDITNILINIPSIIVPTKFRIPELAVVADFYLPYLCCSDCAPITYVLPKIPDAILSIGIRPTEFCDNDEGSYNVSVSPEGGALSASAGGIEQGTYVFKPKGLQAGINTLKYTLPDGRSTSVDVNITAAMKIEFRHEVQDDGATVKFFPFSHDARNAHWDFGDGTTSNELVPTHTYQFDEEEVTFVVKLAVKDGPCFSVIEHPIKLKRPVRSEFSIIPKVFCYRDDRSYDFVATPSPKNLKEIKNDNKLIISRNASGVVSFVPNKQKIVATQDFGLIYNEIELNIRIKFPNAGFSMRITEVPNPTHGLDTTTLHIEAKDGDADQYQWIIQLPNRQLNFSEKKVDVGYRTANISPGQNLEISLITNYDIPGVNCQDRKSFIITPEIFRMFLNKDQFDNNLVL
jgi:hypothetical protein